MKTFDLVLKKALPTGEPEVGTTIATVMLHEELSLNFVLQSLDNGFTREIDVTEGREVATAEAAPAPVEEVPAAVPAPETVVEPKTEPTTAPDPAPTETAAPAGEPSPVTEEKPAEAKPKKAPVIPRV